MNSNERWQVFLTIYKKRITKDTKRENDSGSSVGLIINGPD